MLSHITGLTLPGMIELPGCRSGNYDFDETAARAGTEPAEIVRDVEQRRRNRPQLPVAFHQTVALCVGFKMIHRFDKRNARFCRPRLSATRRPNSGCVLMPEPTAVPPAGNSSTASQRALGTCDGQFNLPRKTADFLSQPQRRGIGQMRAANFDDLVPLLRPSRRATRRSRSRAGISFF